MQLYYDKSFKSYAKNMRKTWQTIREVMNTKKSKNEIPSFFRENGSIISDISDITNGFNKKISGIGPELANAIPTSDILFQSLMGDPEPDNFHFSHVHPTLIMLKTQTKNQQWA